MRQITIGDNNLMQISKEDILELAVIQGCIPNLDFWNYPELIDYNNTKFSDTVVIRYQSTRKSDGIKSDIIVFFFTTTNLSYHYHKNHEIEFYVKRLDVKRLDIDVFNFLIEKGYDIPIY